MNLELITQVLQSPNDTAVRALLEANDTVFWVDWREEDDAIVGYCEDILQTGSLAAELVEVDTENGYEIHITFQGKRAKVPLTYSPQDRHITLYALNQILAPDYEVRFCIASNGSDTLAFLPLPSSQWQKLEAAHGDRLAEHFCRLAPKPNLFTDPLPF